RFVAHMTKSDYRFNEISTAVSGITWVHTEEKSPERYLPETTGAGCAFLDYDNDGWMDIYLVNSGKCDFLNPNPPLRNALYRNNRDGTFTDVTETARVGAGGFGQGVAVGDYDGDGFPDLYLAQYGRSILYHNNGDGTFTDVTEKAGLAAPGWASSAVWFDYDDDGRLDLFVCQFVEFSKSLNKSCGPGEEGKHGYCIPRLYQPMPSWLFHNNGDGTFTDVSKASGIGKYPGKGWGAVATDVNNDGLLDLFVGNDTVPNFLFKNVGQGRFEEIATQAGVAYSADGRARSGMGVDSADFNEDGWMDLFVANIDREMLSIYQNARDETFDDQAGPTGIGAATRLMSGWGLKFLDFDNDGAVDVLVSVNDAAPILLRNKIGNQNHWLGIKLAGKKSNPDAIGARVAYQAGDLKRSRTKVGGGSYLSSHDPRIVLGIGKRTKIDWMEIKWPQPGGAVERFTELPIDRYITIVEGQGKWR